MSFHVILYKYKENNNFLFTNAVCRAMIITISRGAKGNSTCGRRHSENTGKGNFAEADVQAWRSAGISGNTGSTPVLAYQHTEELLMTNILTGWRIWVCIDGGATPFFALYCIAP